MTTQLKFEITLDSDFHVGSGYRKGSEIDSGLLRESDGRPALRGSLLGQLLREAARELLTAPVFSAKGYQRCAESLAPSDNAPAYCRPLKGEQTECPICWIFGSPAHPRRWEFSSAWIKEAGEPGLASTPEEKDWAAQAISRVRINPRTRRAADDQLFIEEVGDSRLVFQFTATWNQPGKADDSEIALFAAAARNLRHLGKSRRRGRGSCQVHLVEVDGHPAEQNFWLDHFIKTWIERTWQPARAKEQTALPVISEGKGEIIDPFHVRVIVRLEEPLLLARRALAGNQFETVSFLPGSVLLGALAARADFRDPDRYNRLVSLFRRGEVRFPFLSPAPAHGSTALFPAFSAPLDIFRCKQHPAGGYIGQYHPDQSASLFEEDRPINCPQCEKENRERGEEESDAVEGLKGKNAIQTFVAGRLTSHAIQRREEMHIRLNPETQRVQPGDLFSYEALEAGQYLVGDLYCRDKETWQALCLEVGLPGPEETIQLRLGKGIRRGYGLVSIAFLPGADDPLPSLRERLPDPTQPFRVLLLSDAIITDRWGRFPTRFEADWLLKELGFETIDQQVSLKVIRGFTRTRPIDTFNNYFGLPRWRDQALVAGSAVGVQITASGVLPEDIWKTLQSAEKRGIGLRRSEGYGRILINHPLYAALEQPFNYNSLQVSLPRVFGGKPSLSDNPVISEAEFRNRWAEQLSGAWGDVTFAEFSSVARLLLAGSDQPIRRLKDALDEMGKPKITRLPGYPLLPSDPNHPYQPRKEKDFFSRGDGKKGLEFLVEKLDLLDQPIYTDRLRAVGLRMLADRVAEAVKTAQQKEMNL